jgi:hypothetical protein
MNITAKPKGKTGGCFRKPCMEISQDQSSAHKTLGEEMCSNIILANIFCYVELSILASKFSLAN